MFRPLFRALHTKLERVEATVLEVVKSFPNVEAGKVSKSSLLKDLNIDSLGTMDLVLDLEDKFQVKLSETDVLKIESVMDAISIFNKVT
jgi:acyl carrier protein